MYSFSHAYLFADVLLHVYNASLVNKVVYEVSVGRVTKVLVYIYPQQHNSAPYLAGIPTMGNFNPYIASSPVMTMGVTDGAVASPITGVVPQQVVPAQKVPRTDRLEVGPPTQRPLQGPLHYHCWGRRLSHTS